MAPPAATIRDLRNHFAKVKKLVETQGEVLVTDNGEPKYRHFVTFDLGQQQLVRAVGLKLIVPSAGK